jgi:hypothetical protein
MDMTFDEAVESIDMDWLERDKENFLSKIRDANYVYDPAPYFALIKTQYPEVLEIRKQMTPEVYANIEQWTQEDWVKHWISWML